MTTQLTDPRGLRSLDPQHAPVSIPVGSFDIDALKHGLEAAVAAKADARDEKIVQAFEGAAQEGTVLTRIASATLPGHETVEVYNEELGIMERTQVFTAKVELETPVKAPRKRRSNKPIAAKVTKVDEPDVVSVIAEAKE